MKITTLLLLISSTLGCGHSDPYTTVRCSVAMDKNVQTGPLDTQKPCIEFETHKAVE